jgi:hypothetical protein
MIIEVGAAKKPSSVVGACFIFRRLVELVRIVLMPRGDNAQAETYIASKE